MRATFRILGTIAATAAILLALKLGFVAIRLLELQCLAVISLAICKAATRCHRAGPRKRSACRTWCGGCRRPSLAAKPRPGWALGGVRPPRAPCHRFDVLRAEAFL